MTSLARLIAVLGPTNTGKTHYALERMAAHDSGMIGFPLRLLARENYDRLVTLKGADKVALITGEERIAPVEARYFVCTVEAMPLSQPVDCLVIDEVQLAATPDRGHIFTERVLAARGRLETLFLGASTIEPLLRRLLPELEVLSRPRLSKLSFAGHSKITRLAPRSAVVAFSATDVYAVAELLRRQKGGAAVVLGALSPRTRNAQVAMFQAGEVDYLVATDAIGMGLNMEIEHVAFAALRKFDGEDVRALRADEAGQIAGRAGRFKTNGTFGTTEDWQMHPDMVTAIETHDYPALKHLRWRNTDLNFTGIYGLLRSLEARPPRPELQKGRPAADYLALQTLSRDAKIKNLANSEERLRWLWACCQIPDYRKTLDLAHARFVALVFEYLCSPKGHLPDEWIQRQLRRLASREGDLDTIMTRIAHVRTLTFLAHRPDWLRDAKDWQERTRKVEDELSDALHERLTARFVDKRTAILLKQLRVGEKLRGAVTGEGVVLVEGHAVGHLQGLEFKPERAGNSDDNRALLQAARRALPEALTARAAEIADSLTQVSLAGGGDILFTPQGEVLWRGVPIARAIKGADILHPALELLAHEALSFEWRQSLTQKLQAEMQKQLELEIPLLFKLATTNLPRAARGWQFQLLENLGTVWLAGQGALLAGLTTPAKLQLQKLGVQLGSIFAYVPTLLKPAAIAWRALLWRLYTGQDVALPPVGRVNWPEPATGAAACLALGYPCLAGFGLRVDALEKFLQRFSQPHELSGADAALLGLSVEAAASVLREAGWRPVLGENGAELWQRSRLPAAQIVQSRAAKLPADADNPFASLASLQTSFSKAKKTKANKSKGNKTKANKTRGSKNKKE